MGITARELRAHFRGRGGLRRRRSTPAPLTTIAILPTILSGRPGFMVGTGIHGTRVFVESRSIAETLRSVLVDEEAGRLTREERITVVDALIRDDEHDAPRRP